MIGKSNSRACLYAIIWLIAYPALATAGGLESADRHFCEANYQKAIEHYLVANREDPENSDILYRIGLCYYLLRESDKSLKFWKLAQEKDPDVLEGKIKIIRTNAMSPALIKGDQILVNPIYYKYKNTRRGDIILLHFPNDPRQKYIKRIIGLPGESLEIIDKAVYINGRKLDEPYIKFEDPIILPKGDTPRDNYGPIIIPSGNYFVMGDNRDASSDSRSGWLLSKNFIIGKALVIYFSTSPDSGNSVNHERVGKLIE